MQFLQHILDFFLHLDTHLAALIAQYGIFTYLILFAIIFGETGLIIAPFLPGDSLLFAAGTFAAKGSFNIFLLFVLLWIAAILGDTVNYAVGKRLGIAIFKPNRRILNSEHLARTEAFYAKYGKKTIILARFLPIIRTVAPFVAGVGRMEYGQFFFYNVVGGFLWVTLFLLAGYFFGAIPAVQHNFTLVIFGIIGVSFIPGIIEFIRHRRKKA